MTETKILATTSNDLKIDETTKPKTLDEDIDDCEEEIDSKEEVCVDETYIKKIDIVDLRFTCGKIQLDRKDLKDRFRYPLFHESNSSVIDLRSITIKVSPKIVREAFEYAGDIIEDVDVVKFLLYFDSSKSVGIFFRMKEYEELLEQGARLDYYDEFGYDTEDRASEFTVDTFAGDQITKNFEIFKSNCSGLLQKGIFPRRTYLFLIKELSLETVDNCSQNIFNHLTKQTDDQIIKILQTKLDTIKSIVDTLIEQKYKFKE